MKKTRALALVLALVLFCSLLSGCGTIRLLLERRAGSDGGMVSFGDMQYERPDLDAMLRDADAIIASLDESANPKSADVRKALDALFDSWSHLRTIETVPMVASLQFTCTVYLVTSGSGSGSGSGVQLANIMAPAANIMLRNLTVFFMFCVDFKLFIKLFDTCFCLLLFCKCTTFFVNEVFFTHF